MTSIAPTRTPTSAILLAAGLSTRMGNATGMRKPFLIVHGFTILEHSCRAFDACAAVREIIVVGHADDVGRLERMAESCPALRKVKRVVTGGELRTDSVRAGLAAIDPVIKLVAIHDVARPLIHPLVIERAIATAAHHGAAVVATPVTDTIKTSSDGEHVEVTLDRSVLWAAQTPQVFRLDNLRLLLEKARAENFRPTDDAALYERYVGPVPIVHGDPTNLKITTETDLVLAAALLRAREVRA